MASFDPATGKPVTATATDGQLGPGSGKSGAAVLRDKFSPWREHAGHLGPMTSTEADKVARALYGRRARRFVRIDGAAQGDGNIRVGTHATIAGVNPLFANIYVLTEILTGSSRNRIPDEVSGRVRLHGNMTRSTLRHPGFWASGAHLARVISIKDPDVSAGFSRLLSPTRTARRHCGRVSRCPSRAICAAPSDRASMAGADPVAGPITASGGGRWLVERHQAPETIGGDRVDRTLITRTARAAVFEQSQPGEVEIETPNGVKATLTDAGGGSIKLSRRQH